MKKNTKKFKLDKENLKKNQDKIKAKAKNTISDYKKFAVKGNAIEMAIGIVIGSAFTNIVNSIVSCVITPVISLLTNKVDISSLFFALDGKKYASIDAAKEAGAAIISYGALINSVINFLILSIVLFVMFKYINSVKAKMDSLDDNSKEKKEETTKKCPFCFSEIDIKATRCPHCTSILEEKKESKQEKISKKK